jgi:hypothetical protein
MDEIVARAMQKWPNVPDVYGWLRLDRRGHWWLKSGSVRAPAATGEPPLGAAPGTQATPVFERITNPGVVEFIGRNYTHDERGRWFFQNGPQRVFVRPDYLPLVYRLDAGALIAHTGVAAGPPTGAWLDEQGALVVAATLGPGLLYDRDLADIADGFVDSRGAAVADELLAHAVRDDLLVTLAGVRLPVQSLVAADIAARFGFDPAPAPPPGQPDC